MANTDKHAARGERALSSLESSEAERMDGAEAETQASAVTGSWDPYEVWLTRVKQPREQQARRRRQETISAEAAESLDTSDTARLRALTAGVPR